MYHIIKWLKNAVCWGAILEHHLTYIHLEPTTMEHHYENISHIFFHMRSITVIMPYQSRHLKSVLLSDTVYQFTSKGHLFYRVWIFKEGFQQYCYSIQIQFKNRSYSTISHIESNVVNRILKFWIESTYLLTCTFFDFKALDYRACKTCFFMFGECRRLASS